MSGIRAKEHACVCVPAGLQVEIVQRSEITKFGGSALRPIQSDRYETSLLTY